MEEEIPGDKITEDDMAQDENGEDSLNEEESASEEVEEEEASIELNESEVSADWEEVEEKIEAPSESQDGEEPASAKPKKKRRAPLGEDRFGPIPPSSKSWEEVEDATADKEVEPIENEEETDIQVTQHEEVEELEEIEVVKSDADEEDMELFPEEPSISPDPTTGEISDSQEMEPVEKEEETEAEDKDFHTEDLENMVDPAEKEKEEIERFLDSLKKERQMRREASEEEVTEDLPPWAENIKTASSEEEGEGAIELDESELEPLEKDEQKLELPADEEEPVKDEYFEVDTEEEVVLEDTASDISDEKEKLDQPGLFKKDEEGTLFGSFAEKRTRGSGIGTKLISRVFDILFISVLWIVSIWGISYILKMPIFDIVNGSIIPLLGFLGILLLIYFFLFYYFLGETLGDYIFSRGK